MESSRTITLFTESRDIGRRPASFAASVLFHCIAIGILSFGFIYTPHIDRNALANRYTIRSIDLETPEQRRQRAVPAKVNYPGPSNQAQTKSGDGKPAVQMPQLRRIANAQKGPQTLVQPDLPTQLVLAQEVPVPTMVIWSPKEAEVKAVVAPQPEKPTAADVKPMPAPPNQELNLSDNSITAKPTPAPKLPTPTGTTSPIAVHAPARVQLPPATVAQAKAPPTPVAIMSLSDLKMPDGKVVLPPVNESAAVSTQGALAPGKPQDASTHGNGSSSSKGHGPSTAAHGDTQTTPVAKALPAASPSQKTNAQETNAADPNNQPASTQITLPRDGQFGAVVVGQSLDEQYPELTSVWSGRLAYTVFLHVGLPRSWILQYSLPRVAEAQSGGAVQRLEAPWPYSIVRPNLPPGTADGNTIMVHGFVNSSGRFEGLSVIFPPQFPQAEFVLRSLQNWQFRPAAQNQQPVRVEILLIIPGEF